MEALETLAAAAATLRGTTLCGGTTNRTVLVLDKRVRVLQLLELRQSHVRLHLFLL